MKTIFKVFVSLLTLVIFSSSLTPLAYATHTSRGMNRKDFIKLLVQELDLDPLRSRYRNCFYDVRTQEYADEVCFARAEGWLQDTYDTYDYDRYDYARRDEFFPLERVRPEEARRITARAFQVSRSSLPSGFGSTLSRGEADRLIREAFQESDGAYRDGYDDYYYDTDGVRRRTPTPDGYPDPYDDPYYRDPYRDYNDPYYSSSSSACRLAINRPSRSSSTYSVNYCPLDRTGEPSDQILLGQRYFSNVNGQSLDFRLNDRVSAMAVVYASEMFNVNPNFLLGVGIRESRLGCTNMTEGCFGLGSGQVQTVKDRFSMYFDQNDSYSALVQTFPTAAVLASLYVRYSEDYSDRSYSTRSLYYSAADPEARTKLASIALTRGYTDYAIRDLSQNSQCRSYSNIFQCSVISSSAFNIEQSYVDYCRDLMNSNNFYDVRLSRQDLTNFIDVVLRPTYSSDTSISWSAVSDRLHEAFRCLDDSNGTISFRYDFKLILREAKEILPPAPSVVL